MSEYFELGRWRWIVGNSILFKMSFGWVIFDNVWESYAWSKLSWLFLQNPNLATFESWWVLRNPWWIMINLDQMIKYPSNDNVDKESWSLTVFGSQLTFALAQSIFRPLSNWLSKLLLQGLKFDMDDIENILGQWWALGYQLDSSILMQHETLVEVCCLRRRTCLVNS